MELAVAGERVVVGVVDVGWLVVRAVDELVAAAAVVRSVHQTRNTKQLGPEVQREVPDP